MYYNAYAERFALSNCPFYSKLQAQQFTLQLAPRSYSVRTYWPSFSNANPVSTLFAAVAVVKPIAATIVIALYLQNSTSHHEHSYSKYALADCSLIFSFQSNYDRSCEHNNNTVATAAECFTDVVLQDMNLAVPRI